MTRRERLEELGAWYAEESFAVAWTEGLEGESAKRVTTRGWQNTEPLSRNPGFVAGMFATRGESRNPAVVARPSGLVLVECDSPEDAASFVAAIGDAPVTLAAQSSPGRAHYYFRTPEASPEYVGFRFEAGNVTASKNMYLVAPPALHPSGGEYAFVNWPHRIATMPRDVYEKLIAMAGESQERMSLELQEDALAKVPAGNRRTYLFKYACSQRRYGLSQERTLENAHRLNEERCDPPLRSDQVEEQVRGAYERYTPQTAAYVAPGGKPVLSSEAAPAGNEGGPGATTSRLVARRLSEVQAEERHALLGDKRLPLGAITIFQGMPGMGKSTWTADLVARVSRQGGYVIISGQEDGVSSVIKPRVVAAGGDPAKVVYLETLDGGNLLLPDHVEDLRAEVERYDAELVVLDTLFSHFGAGVDSNNDQSSKRAMVPLDTVAKQTGCSILVLHHENASGASNAIIRGSGSKGGIYGTPRSQLVIEEGGENGVRRITNPKNNWFGDQPPEVVTTENADVEIDGLSLSVERVIPWSPPVVMSPFDEDSWEYQAGLVG